MENQIKITSVMSDAVTEVYNDLIDARGSLVKTSTKTGEVITNYAKCLQAAFGEEWYALKGKARAGVKSERGMFKAAMIEAGQEKNVDVYWQRVKEASGYVTAGNKVSGSMSVDDKIQAELKTIINRIFTVEETGQECIASDHKGALMDIFEALGGDVMKLGLV
jgi:hypothetical protein